MKFFNYLLLASLLILPLVDQKPVEADMQEYIKPALGALVAVGTIGGGIYLILTDKPKQDNHLKSIEKFCDRLNYIHNEEFKIIKEYDKSRPHFFAWYESIPKQEKLRADLVEQALGRSNENAALPLHSYTKAMGTNLHYLQININTLKKSMKQLDKKINQSSGTTKIKLTKEKEALVKAIEKCESLKKRMTTMRGALMKSREYSIETCLDENRKSNASWFANKPNADNTQAYTQQQMHHQQ